MSRRSRGRAPDSLDDLSAAPAGTDPRADADPSVDDTALAGNVAGDPAASAPATGDPAGADPEPADPEPVDASAGDDDDADVITPDVSARPRPAPSPAAAAARRARRIGGPSATTSPRPGATPKAAAPKAGAVKDGSVTGRRTAPAPAGTSLRKPAAELEVARGRLRRIGAVLPHPARLTGRGDGARVAPWLRWLPAMVLTAGALAMAVILVTFSHGIWWSKPATNDIRDRVVAAAKDCLAQANTYTYKNLADFQKRADACVTGSYRTNLNKTVATVLTPNAVPQKATQTAQLNAAGVERVNKGRWVVLVFGQVNITNVNNTKGTQQPFAAEVTMSDVNGRWLISRVDTVPPAATGQAPVSPTPGASAPASPTTGSTTTGSAKPGTAAPTARSTSGARTRSSAGH